MGYTSDQYYLIDVSEHQGFARMLKSDKKIYLAIHLASKHMEHIEESLDYILNDFK